MLKKSLMAVVLVLVLIWAGSTVWAQGGGGWGRGGGGYGFGPCRAGSGGFGPQMDQETVALRDNLVQKRQEMFDLLSAAEVDETKVKAVQGEINQIRQQLSDKRLASMIEFRKNNPDWRPGYGKGYGRGYGQGRGQGRSGGQGYGPGYCWR